MRRLWQFKNIEQPNRARSCLANRPARQAILAEAESWKNSLQSSLQFAVPGLSEADFASLPLEHLSSTHLSNSFFLWHINWYRSMDARLNHLHFLPLFSLPQRRVCTRSPSHKFSPTLIRSSRTKTGHWITKDIPKIQCIAIQRFVNTDTYFGSTVLISFSSWSAARDCEEKQQLKPCWKMCLRGSSSLNVSLAAAKANCLYR